MTERHWPKKAYKDDAFLGSTEARPVRVLCELLEPQKRFEENDVRNTIVFFGSARTLPLKSAQERLARLEAEAQAGKAAADGLERARADVAMARYYEDAALLAEKLTAWSLGLPEEHRFYISSGGGPGIMQAANCGALKAGGKTVALNISLPHEQEPNPCQTAELSFEFHYFFMRKFWFVNLARSLVVFPGGFGTCDELFELLTLVQTRKLHGYRSVLIYGAEFWRELIDFEVFAKWGMISPEDLRIFRFCDAVDEAFDILKEEYTRSVIEHRNGDPRSPEARLSAPQA